MTRKYLLPALASFSIFTAPFSAYADSGNCRLDLYEISYVDSQMGQIIQQTKIETKNISVEVPADADAYWTYNLTGSIGDFKIIAQVDNAEKSISSVQILDQDHAVEFNNRDTVMSFSNFKTNRSVGVFCSFVIKKNPLIFS